IPQHRQEMTVGLNGKTLEPTLIQVALAYLPAMLAPPPNVSRANPLHEGREILGPFGPQDEVPVIAHQAVAEDSHSRSLPALLENLHKRGKVAEFLEDV